MRTTVTNIVDGDTFDVDPGWSYGDQNGSRVRIAGIDTPEVGKPGYAQAKKKLSDLLLNEVVDLRNPQNISYGRLVCDVYLNGRNIVR